MAPGIDYEQSLQAQGYRFIAGIDEAGRGCWAGPVVAAAVVLPPSFLDRSDLMMGIDDSKLLTPLQRQDGYQRLLSLCEGVGVGIAPNYVIDIYGIVAATRLAMTVALLTLTCSVDALLIDAMRLDTTQRPQQALIKGESRSLSIAAASIVAKVTRDRLMTTADAAYPGYGFALHKGYGTAVHRRALESLGPCSLHRMTFRPVAAISMLHTNCF